MLAILQSIQYRKLLLDGHARVAPQMVLLGSQTRIQLVLEAAFKSAQYIHVPMATDVRFLASLTAAAPRSVRRPQEKHRLDSSWRR